MRSCTRIGLLLCLVVCCAPPIGAAVLTPAEVLRVTFTTSVNPNPVPDVLTLNLGIVQVIAAHTSRTGALYNGDTLLGSGSTSSFGGHVGALSLSPARSFRSPTSVWDFDFPAVADFTTIANGTINGRIDFSIATGAMDINLANVSLGMGFATAPNIFIVTNPPPMITSVQIIPEPSVMGMLSVVPAAMLRRRATDLGTGESACESLS